MKFWFSGSKQDNLVPMLSQKCRAFAMENNGGEKDQLDAHNPLLLPLEVTNLNNMKPDRLSLDDDEEDVKPDLTQIIRSLDTPPPS
jgi:hypothetical protein